MNIHGLIAKTVVTVEMDDTLRVVREILENTCFHHLLVVDAGKLFGVISDRDVRGARCRETSQRCLGESWCLPGPTTVRELVASAPTIRPGDGLAVAATILGDHQRRAVAVINQAGRLLGAVSEDGILSRLTERLLG